jgi:5-methylcytosine-specific restriction endonuclease McrA
LKCYDDLPSFVSNLFCEADNLQVLCKSCHKTKTAEERKKK